MNINMELVNMRLGVSFWCLSSIEIDRLHKVDWYYYRVKHIFPSPYTSSSTGNMPLARRVNIINSLTVQTIYSFRISSDHLNNMENVKGAINNFLGHKIKQEIPFHIFPHNCYVRPSLYISYLHKCGHIFYILYLTDGEK